MNTKMIKVGNFVMIESQPVKITKVINRKTGEVILENCEDVFTITNQEIVDLANLLNIASNKPDSEDLPEGKISTEVPVVTPDISDLDQQIIDKIITGVSEEEIDSDIQKSVNSDYQNLIVLHDELKAEFDVERTAHEALKTVYSKLQTELANCKNQLSTIAQLKTNTTPTPVATVQRIVIKNDIID